MSGKALSIVIVLGLGIMGLAWLFITISSQPSVAQESELLDEQTLLNIAIEAAQFYGLKSEPEILISDYILGREWGPVMRGSDVQYQPDMMVYVVSLKGEFEPGKSGGSFFAFPGQETPLVDTFAPEGFTFGINASTGFIMFERTAPVTDLSSMTTDSDRAMYELLSSEEWDPLVEIIPFEGPMPTVFPWTQTLVAPETTADPLPLPLIP